ncbi:hypothetical protein DNTS_018766 [Danionella cerebrum]|uniref:Zinc finger protein 865 n=1 Tax=Danionella cerebrum TaxID=2873325 RepID=A0A553PYG0_9TELE|nr:hypothetical protein DNTS_018766 [Danionella translucida]
MTSRKTAEAFTMDEELVRSGVLLGSCLVPPLFLFCSSMWQLLQQKRIIHYGKVEEFVAMVTEAKPALIGYRRRVQLMLGLRARMILEMCREAAHLRVIQTHLDRMQIPLAPTGHMGSEDDLGTALSNFKALVLALLKDPVEKAYFFQEVFPVEYGERFDTALSELMWEMLSCLEKLLPVPDLKQFLLNFESGTGESEASESGLDQREWGQTKSGDSRSWQSEWESMSEDGSGASPGKAGWMRMGSARQQIVPGQREYLEKTVSWLSAAPTALEESICLEPQDLKLLLQNPQLFRGYNQNVWSRPRHESGGDLDSWSASGLVFVSGGRSTGDCILSSLSIPPSTRASPGSEPLMLQLQASTLAILNPSALGSLDTFIITQVEVTSQEEASIGREEVEATSGGIGKSEVASSGPEDMMESSSVTDKREEASGGREDREEASAEKLVEESSEGMEEGESTHRRTENMKNNSAGTEQKEGKAAAVEVLNKVNLEEINESVTILVLERTHNMDEPPRDGGTEGVVTRATLIEDEELPEPAAPECHPLRRGRGRPRKNRGRKSLTQEQLHSVKLVNTAAVPNVFSGDSITPDSPPNKEELQESRQEERNALRKRGRVLQLATENPRARYACDSCGRKFTRSSDVRRHQLTHTGERPFHCGQCQKTFQHAWDLTKHCQREHGQGSFACQLCPATFTNLRLLKAHHSQSHVGPPPLYCSICGQASATLPALEQHRLIHGAAPQYHCQHCGQGFESLKERSLHRRTNRCRPSHRCPLCPKSFTRRSDVQRHQLTHNGERPHCCKVCGKSFGLRSGLLKHQLTHSGARPHLCQSCGKSFTQRSVLQRHQRIHTGERPFLCAQCGKSFLSQGELAKHERCHGETRPYSCPLCHKGFKQKRALQEHLLAHSGARRFPCQQCGKSFARPFALIRHDRIHSGERPFPCGHCQRRFLTAAERALHTRTHTGERPYPCGYCQRRFRSSSERARHQQTHIRERDRHLPSLKSHQSLSAGKLDGSPSLVS